MQSHSTIVGVITMLMGGAQNNVTSYQYILDKFHFLKLPKTFRVIIAIILCCPCYMPKYVPRLESITHPPSGRALCLLTLGHISAYSCLYPNEHKQNTVTYISLEQISDSPYFAILDCCLTPIQQLLYDRKKGVVFFVMGLSLLSSSVCRHNDFQVITFVLIIDQSF